jgi:hypothetical protein
MLTERGNKEDEGGKGKGDGSYSGDVNERDHSGNDDGKWRQRHHKSTQHNNQPKATIGTMRAVITRAATASPMVCGWRMCAWLGCRHA